MPEDKEASSIKQNLETVLASAKSLLSEMTSLQAQTTEQAKASDGFRKKVEVDAAAAKERLVEINAIKSQIDQQLKAADDFLKQAAEEATALKNSLPEINALKAQAEQHLKGAEAARKKADEEATYASQAKNNTEIHAKAVATFKGQAEGEFTTIATNSQKSAELVQAITVAKASTDADSKVINESRKAIELATQGLVAAAEQGALRLSDVEGFKTSASSVAKEAVSMRDEAIQARNKIETAQKDVTQLATQAAAHLTKITEANQSSAELFGEISEVLETAKKNETELNAVLERLKKSHEIASGFEARVTKSSQDLESLIQRVEKLLPGATSASLASSFNKQKDRFSLPQKRWLTTFIWCIAILVVVSLPSFINALVGKTIFGNPADNSWDGVWRGLTMRLPIVIPLVWLAVYAGRNYMLSLRLEEDYAYKEAISISFEGYKREMEKIAAGDATNPTPITTLCINVLRAIAERPGRIYEGKQHDITLAAELRTAVEKAEELGKKTIAS